MVADIDKLDRYFTVEVVVTEGVGELCREGYSGDLRWILDRNVGKAPGCLIHTSSDGLLGGRSLAVYERPSDSSVFLWLEEEEPVQDKPPQKLGLKTTFHQSAPGGGG